MTNKAKTRVHLAHCYKGEYATNCKYGDDENCPAKPKVMNKTQHTETKWQITLQDENNVHLCLLTKRDETFIEFYSSKDGEAKTLSTIFLKACNNH